MTTMETARLSLRDTYRGELAALLGIEPDAVDDEARLREDLALDSLAMMRLLTYAEERGVEPGAQRAWPATVGEVLTLLEKAVARQISVRGVGRDGQTVNLGPSASPQTRPADPLAPRLSTKTFRLMPVVPDDLGYLYALATHPETCFRWRYRGAPPSLDRFAADLGSQVLVQFGVRTVTDNQLAGLVVAYNAGQALHHACVAAVFPPHYVGSGTAAQATALFVDYLFHTFPLRKLYLEVPGFNWPQVQSGQGRMFTVEGVLRDHDSYAGTTWDHRICAIYRPR